MNRLGTLVKSEIDRLRKYNLFAALLVTLIFWVVLAWFLNGDELKLFIPLIFLMDAIIMNMLLVGVTMFYEKEEHTINSIMVTPVREDEYLVAKVLVSVANSMFTVLFLSVVLYVMKGMTLNYWLLVPAMIVVTAFHSVVGIRLAYHARTFTSVLFNVVGYMVALTLPTVFIAVGSISEEAARFFILLPPEAANVLIGASVRDVEPWRLWVGFAYLIVLGVGLYRYLVKPHFNTFIMRETGV